MISIIYVVVRVVSEGTDFDSFFVAILGSVGGVVSRYRYWY